MMRQEDARATIVREWLARPAAERSRVEALIFATKARQRYTFRCAGDPHQYVMGWLEPHVVADPPTPRAN